MKIYLSEHLDMFQSECHQGRGSLCDRFQQVAQTHSQRFNNAVDFSCIDVAGALWMCATSFRWMVTMTGWLLIVKAKILMTMRQTRTKDRSVAFDMRHTVLQPRLKHSLQTQFSTDSSTDLQLQQNSAVSIHCWLLKELKQGSVLPTLSVWMTGRHSCRN